MMGHAGKKLLFMGQDFGQYREWNEDCSIDWHLLEEKENRSLHSFLRDLLQLYKSYPALYEADYLYEGFSWVNADDASRSIYSFIRNPKNHLSLSEKPGGKSSVVVAAAKDGETLGDAQKTGKSRASLLFVVNMTPIDHEEYWVGMPKAKEARLILTEEGLCKEEKRYPVVKGECDGRNYHLAYPLKGFGCALFAFTEEPEDSCANALSPGKEENLLVSEEKQVGQQKKKENSKVAEKVVEQENERAKDQGDRKTADHKFGDAASSTGSLDSETESRIRNFRVREEAG